MRLLIENIKREVGIGGLVLSREFFDHLESKLSKQLLPAIAASIEARIREC